MKGTDFFENIKSTFEYSGTNSATILDFIRKSRFENIAQHPQSRFNRVSLIRLFIFVKLIEVKSISKLLSGQLKSLIPFGRELLYKVKNNPLINWRNILLGQSREMAEKIEIDVSAKDPHKLPCFIIDDTDIEKRGWCMELIGKVFSHVTRKYSLGYKCLNLSYWTGKNTLHLDFSLHAELGKKKNQGLTPKQQQKRYTKARPGESPGAGRVKEYWEKKTGSAISMLKRAVRKGFKARYLLADSWFFNKGLVQFARQTNIHLISRPKFNNWKYVYKGKDYTVGGLCQKFKYDRTKKWNKNLRVHYVGVQVEFQGNPVRIFFYKEKKRGTKWQAIITTDLKIGAVRAFEIYQNRWSIEVSYKELKQHLKLGRCQSQDFDAQISDTTQCMLAYNYLSTMKAVNEHQSIGKLFDEISAEWISPTVMQKFWDHLFELLKEIAELFEIPLFDILEKCVRKKDFFGKMELIYQNLGAET